MEETVKALCLSLLFETTVQFDNSAQPRVKLNYESRLGWRVTFITLLQSVECIVRVRLALPAGRARVGE